MWQLLLLVFIVHTGLDPKMVTEERNAGLFTKAHFCAAAGQQHMERSKSVIDFTCEYIEVKAENLAPSTKHTTIPRVKPGCINYRMPCRPKKVRQ